MKKTLALLLTLLMVLSSLSISAFADSEPNVVLEDTGCWGEAWPNAYNVGWRYENFDPGTITGITVGMKDAAGKLIVEYTADVVQIEWQLDNGYIPASGNGQNSAPFYQEYDGTPIAAEAGEDWTVTIGEGFCAWKPALFYVAVTTETETYNLSRVYSGKYAEVAENPHVDAGKDNKCDICGKVLKQPSIAEKLMESFNRLIKLITARVFWERIEPAVIIGGIFRIMGGLFIK